MGRGALRGLDGLAFVGPALLLAVGVFAEAAGDPAIMLMSIIGGVCAMSSFYGTWYSFRVIMNFADDMGLRRGFPFAAMWMLRAASAFWIWLSIAFWLLARIHTNWHDMLSRAAAVFLAIGAIVFALGVGCFVIYAWVKQRAHDASKM